MAHYADPLYWDERYKKDQFTYEWYQSYIGVKDMIT